MRRLSNFKLKMLGAWQPLILALAAALGLYLLLFSQLSSVPAGIAPPEVNSVQAIKHSSISLSDILLENPMDLPYKLTLLVVSALGGSSLYAARFVSAAYGLLSVLAVFFIMKRWHSVRIAYFTSGLYAASAWLLHTTRLATPDSQYLLLPAICALGVISHNKNYLTFPRGIMFSVFCVGIVYIPGAVWLVAAALIWRRKALMRLLGDLGKWRLAIFGFIPVLFLPLVFAFANNPKLLQIWIGLEQVPAALDFLKNLALLPINLMAYVPDNPIMNLGNLPYLSIFSSTILALGIYSAIKNFKLDRERATIGSIVIISILISLSNVPAIALAPFIFILIGNGLVYLAQEWFVVFPKNPLARYFGVTLIIAATILSINFQYHRYFNAWNKSPQTRQVFNASYEEL